MLNNIKKEDLYRLYYIEKKTMQEIGNIFGYNRRVISKLLRQYDLRDDTKFLSLKINKNMLRKLYIDDDLTVTEIAKKFNCATCTIVSRLELFKIPRKSMSEAVTRIKISKEELERLYLVEKKSAIAIAKIYDCGKTTILKKLKSFSIKRRTSKEYLLLGNYSGENSPRWLGGPSKCQICGVTCAHNAIHCMSCDNILKKERNSGKGNPMYGRQRFGKDNPNYIDGRTSLARLIRELAEYADWRKAVYERDNYTCQDCEDNQGGNLQAHHRKPFAIILNEFLNKFNRFSQFEDKETLLKLAMDYEDFWKVSNGITLCNKCHDNMKKDTFIKIKKSGEK